MKLAKSPREEEADAIIATIRKVTTELTSTKEKARAFLISHGYITKTGKLTKRYGG